MSYEYDCPQFVDFMSNEVNNLSISSPRPEVFLSSSSPAIKRQLGISRFKVPLAVKKPLLSTNSATGTTIKKVNFLKTTNVTDSAKINEKKVLSKRLSKSDGALNAAPKQALKKRLEYFPKHKRSLSETDLKMKKKITATTPMCLKRTIQNVKNKTLKSSEEMELEKIAELQKETRKHLRANEVTMRRQKMKQIGHPQKPLFETQKKEVKARVPPQKPLIETQKKEVKSRVPVKNIQKDCKTFEEKLNLYTKKAEPQVQKKEVPVKKHSKLYNETLKKIELLKKTASNSSDTFIRDLVTPITSQQLPEATFERMSICAAMKQLPVKKDATHRGILFNSSHRKLDIRAFNFQNATQGTTANPRSEKGKALKVEGNDSFQTPRLARNKENNAMWRKASTNKK